ncbi:hypothetical protein [Leucobacter aridicollis]|uniref:hypothetical protein n=1 Tax=Leucobacter aridicollis TaxID=283878 RepID=UPI0021054D8D|nr:hypothetical protein [Leucobacter aridicollis]UTX53294.1 hypothetical protein KI794_00550 [Leucobacter aridicollis]
MYDQEMLAKLQATWPETTDYLTKLGQLNNDLMVLREMKAADEHIPSWLELLGYSEDDFMKTPTAMEVLRFLNQQGIVVQSRLTVPKFLEFHTDQEELYEAGEESTPEVLEVSPPLELRDEYDAMLWALPELQEKLVEWAKQTAARHGSPAPLMTLTQATILMLVVRALDHDLNKSPGWQAECLQSALSSEFYQKAAHPLP